ncbi:MAG TPA: hypothetical protein VND91_09170 [Candidatus Saccharimonadia bacterium]|nr:hypothetical protein [Candidatus Saccharimonadia bacterium]
MAAMPTSNIEFLRHDLLIELSRTEMALENLGSRPAANQPELAQTLEQRKAKIAEALAKLPR